MHHHGHAQSAESSFHDGLPEHEEHPMPSPAATPSLVPYISPRADIRARHEKPGQPGRRRPRARAPQADSRHGARERAHRRHFSGMMRHAHRVAASRPPSSSRHALTHATRPHAARRVRCDARRAYGARATSQPSQPPPRRHGFDADFVFPRRTASACGRHINIDDDCFTQAISTVRSAGFSQ